MHILKDKTSFNLALAQVCLFVGIVICVILIPSGLDDNTGASFYGVHSKTVAIFVISLVLCSFFTLMAAASSSLLPPHGIIKLCLYLSSLFILIIAATPYNAGRLIGDIHVNAGICLFAMQFVLSIWLALRVYKNVVNSIFIVLLALVGVFSFYYNQTTSGYLIEGQLIFQILFSIIVIRSLTGLDSVAGINTKKFLRDK